MIDLYVVEGVGDDFNRPHQSRLKPHKIEQVYGSKQDGADACK